MFYCYWLTLGVVVLLIAIGVYLDKISVTEFIVSFSIWAIIGFFKILRIHEKE